MLSKPPYLEQTTTVVRPKDSDRVILTVEPQRKFIEPDSPNSLDQLIGPQSPDIDDSLDRCIPGSGKGHYKRVFDYDNRINEELCGDFKKEPISKQSCSAAVIHHPESQCKHDVDDSIEGAVGGQYSGAVDGQHPVFGSTASCMDPPKNNPFSQSADIVRYRPSPKHPVTQKSSPIVLEKRSTEKIAQNLPLCPHNQPDTTSLAKPCSIDSEDQSNARSCENYENIPIIRGNADSGDIRANYANELNELGEQKEEEKLLTMSSVV